MEDEFSQDHNYTFVKSQNKSKTFEEFQSVMRQHEANTNTRFVYYNGTKSFSRESIEISSKMRLHWYDSLPYYHCGARTYICHQGKDINLYQKKRYAKLREEKNTSGEAIRRRYNIVQGTKKRDCPATIIVTRVYILPAFTVDALSSVEKRKKSAEIKNRIKTLGVLEGEEFYIFNLPGISEHKNHVEISPEKMIRKLRTKERRVTKKRMNTDEEITIELEEQVVQEEIVGCHDDEHFNAPAFAEPIQEELLNQYKQKLNHLSLVTQKMNASKLSEVNKKLGEILESIPNPTEIPVAMPLAMPIRKPNIIRKRIKKQKSKTPNTVMLDEETALKSAISNEETIIQFVEGVADITSSDTQVVPISSDDVETIHLLDTEFPLLSNGNEMFFTPVSEQSGDEGNVTYLVMLPDDQHLNNSVESDIIFEHVQQPRSAVKKVKIPIKNKLLL